ncbi:MAG: response regulator [Bacteroidales bacterium]
MNILIIEDNPADADLATRGLENSLPGCRTEIAPDIKTAWGLLKQGQKYDLALLDMNLPDGNGMDLLVDIRQSKTDIAIVMLTGTGDEEIAVAALKAGADDYIVKTQGYISQLPEVITSAIGNHKKNLQRKTEIINVLYIEHSSADIDLTLRHIKKYAPYIRINTAATAEEATRMLYGVTPDKFPFHVILMDYNLPGSNALDFIKMLRQQMKINLPVIIVSGKGKEEMAVLALKVGASEYITKSGNYLSLLPSLINSVHKQHELIRAKERAEESDRLKTAFLNNISHEIRTPMNAITGFSELINTPGLSPEKLRNFTDVIIKSGKQLLSIITDIISIASVEAGQEKLIKKETNINSLCNLVLEQYSSRAQENNVDLSFKSTLNENEAVIITDETKLLQILGNITGNAIKFTEEGSVQFGCKFQNDELLFYVKDTGIGIPREMHKEIFKRFRQANGPSSKEYGGSGLGLSIAKAYLDLLGGKIWLDSAPGKGSEFYFSIPAEKPAQTNPEPAGRDDKAGSSSSVLTTLLIAEDEDFNFLLLEEFLNDTNINIIRACNGKEAVNICKSSKHIDLILMDIKMPLMNGLEATREIKKFMPGIPVIAQTAYAGDYDRNKAASYGCNDFLSKPFKQEDLLKKINLYL